MHVLFHSIAASWVPTPLAAGAVIDFIPGGSPVLREASGSAADSWEARLLAIRGGGGAVEVHLIVKSGAAVRVGGRRVVGGLKRLAGRREALVVGGRPYYLAVDEVARIEVFTGDVAVRCARCKGEILPGTKNVAVCGFCGTVMHEDELTGRRCFSYGPCVSCGTKPKLESAAAWTPDLL